MFSGIIFPGINKYFIIMATISMYFYASSCCLFFFFCFVLFSFQLFGVFFGMYAIILDKH